MLRQSLCQGSYSLSSLPVANDDAKLTPHKGIKVNGGDWSGCAWLQAKQN